MADTSFLNWPFFSDSHRTLVPELERWAESEIVGVKELSGDHLKQTRHYVSRLGEGGWLGLAVTAPHGGRSERLDVRSLCLVRETLARYSSLAEFAFAIQGLGSGPITLFGSEHLKKNYLPKVAAGKFVASLAMSEAEAGSDISAIQTSAELDGSHYVLNGEKTWISNAGIADFYVVFARTGEQPGTKGLSAFVVDADTSGAEVTEQMKIISPHPIGTLRFTDCRIPKGNLLGESGGGFKVAMATLDVFRSTVGAAALGFARRALDEALEWATKRKLFGKILADFQMTQERIADMAVEIDASALLVYRAAWTKDSGAERITREASMAKMYATEAAQGVIDKALQLLGGRGVLEGSVLESLYRDIRPLRIYEGATEIQKIVVARETLAKHSA